MQATHGTALARALAVFGAVMVCTPSPGGTPAMAAGDLVTRSQRVPELVLGSPEDDYSVSRKDFEAETGRYYRWSVTSKGMKEYWWRAPDFFRNIWIRQIVINKLEVHTPALEKFEFDDQGTIELDFIPIRSGTYKWWVDGLEDKGMTGTITVK